MNRPFWLLICVLVLAGCTATTISGVWKDPQYTGGKLQNVLVVGIARKEIVKRLYEDSFVRELEKNGVKGSASYTIIPGEQQANEEFIRQQVRDKGFNYILMTRVADKKTVEVTHPSTVMIDERYYDRGRYYSNAPYYRRWHDYYDRSFTTIQTIPGYTTQTELVILETNIYDALSDEIIYSVQTESLIDFSAEQIINEIVDTIVGNLKENQLI